MGSFSGLPVSFVPSWETVVACHGCTSANWATLFCGEQYLVWTWKSSGIGNGMRHILEGTERFLKSRLDSEDAEQKPYRFFWTGLAIWLPTSGHMGTRAGGIGQLCCMPHVTFDGRSYLGRGSKVTPQVLFWGNCRQKIQKNTEKAGEQPCKTCT